MGLRAFFGQSIAKYLSQDVSHRVAAPRSDEAALAAHLRPGDVLLIEGNSRISGAVKYLTQSTWSHSSLYVGEHLQQRKGDSVPVEHCFIEADIQEGVRSVGLAQYRGLPARICRPVGLSEVQLRSITGYAIGRLGDRYDLRNIYDLARYLLPTPPLPQAWRRPMMNLGSGDPSRAICSTLIIQAFYTVHYPVLPNRTADCHPCEETHRAMRDYSLFVPRDFDISPYFQIIKPELEQGFHFQERCA